MSLRTQHISSPGESWENRTVGRSAVLMNARNMEDFVTWVDSSKIKRNIMKYRDKLDDFELEAL
jgi:hypothetical protein